MSKKCIQKTHKLYQKNDQDEYYEYGFAHL